MPGVTVAAATGQSDDAVFVLYTGGTIGMGPDARGALVPLDLRELAAHLPSIDRLGVGLTVASFDQPLDSSAITPDDWLRIADTIVDNVDGHVGVVVLHGTDTMAYTASALSFLLDGIDLPIVLTGSQRPITALRSDGRENLITALEFAAAHARGGPLIPEVAVFFDDVLLRGNRTVKLHADSYRGFGSPNLGPLATAGVTLEYDHSLIRPPRPGPLRRVSGVCRDVIGIRLHPGLDRAGLEATLSRPGLRGVVLEAYGAGNGPTDDWFVETLRRHVAAGTTIVVATQCLAGSVTAGQYATGAALMATGAVPGADMTFEAALTKLMVLLDGDDGTDRGDATRRLIQQDLAGELTALPE